jgi:cobalt-precorrin 5A hydrolase/precorrin-3B C17-methyltransferase
MNTGNKAAAFYITDRGRLLAGRLKGRYPDLDIIKFAKGNTEKVWGEYGSFIFIMAAGIVVRTIAPLIRDKRSDPAVVVLDEKGNHAISLLSGHLGGANDLAREIADFLRAEAVITTGSDVSGLTSIDVWAGDNDLVIEDWELLPRVGTRFLNKGRLSVYTDVELPMPAGFVRVNEPSSADLLVTHRTLDFSRDGKDPSPLMVRPRNLVVGIGCNRGTSADEIEKAVRKVLAACGFAFASVRSVATIDMKTEEPGIRLFSNRYSFDILSFTPGELNGVAGIAKSEAAFRATGARAVAEPAALLAAGAKRLLVPKNKVGNVTVAVAQMKERKATAAKKQGKLYVVGTGPGAVEHVTPYAQRAIAESDTIVGYGTYLDLIRELIRDKEVFSTGMTQEIDRCRKAIELALDGKTVSVISGGDPGIYAMAGLVFEICRDMACHVLTIEVIPGISALNACAARLGAPLMHDFASISLSDRLTPWELIERRLDAAAMADFVIILYNPKSKGRAGHIGRAREIILKHRSPDTPVGIVKGAMRADERIVLSDLGKMLDCEIDMQTTVIIGNSKTFPWNNLMITPRGYEKKLKP